MLTLSDVIEALTVTRPETPTPVITEAAIDSRQVIPGGLFVAIPGERVDGHEYVDEAFKRGASFALIQHEVTGDYPSLDLRSGLDAEALAALTPPFCLLVKDTLAALQQAASSGVSARSARDWNHGQRGQIHHQGTRGTRYSASVTGP